MPGKPGRLERPAPAGGRVSRSELRMPIVTAPPITASETTFGISKTEWTTIFAPMKIKMKASAVFR
jgi:hypothetical protein